MTVWKATGDVVEPGTSVRWLLAADTEHRSGEMTTVTFPCEGSDVAAFGRAEELERWGYTNVKVIRQTIMNEVVTPISAKE